MKLSLTLDNWEMRRPFVTAAVVRRRITAVTATLERDGAEGRGEAIGVRYLDETPDSIVDQIEEVRSEIESGINREELQRLLPSGGARNSVDCALWDLEAKLAGKRVWESLGIEANPVTTVFTIALDTPENMARQAKSASEFSALKLKVDDKETVAKIGAVRAARPDAALVVDANQSWSLELLGEIAGALVDRDVGMVEQPLPVGEDSGLIGLEYPLPICADESCQDRVDLEKVADRYRMINIKLDKCGGLTEGLAMVQACRERDLSVMVGNMLGSSLAMAPGFVVAQFCRYVDLDGPLLQREDRDPPIDYRGSRMQPPSKELWG